MGSAVGDLLNPGDKLPDRSLPPDCEPAVSDLKLQPLGGEGSAKNHLLGVLGNIDEAAAAGEKEADLADVDIALGVGLRHAEKSEVVPASVVEVELVALVDAGLGIVAGAKNHAPGRHPADQALLDREGVVGQGPVLVRHRRNSIRNADADVKRGSGKQFH